MHFHPIGKPEAERATVGLYSLGGIGWRGDGKELLFLGVPGFGIMSVDVARDGDFTASPPKMLFRVPGGASNPGQLSSVSSRDGQRFVFQTPAPTTTSSR